MKKQPIDQHYDQEEEFNNEEEEDFSLNDLQIFEEDEIEEPTQDEAIEYAIYLGFDLENYPDLSINIAYNALTTKLPENYKKAVMKNDKNCERILYLDIHQGEILTVSPIDLYAVELYKKEIIALQKGSARSGSSGVTPKSTKKGGKKKKSDKMKKIDQRHGDSSDSFDDYRDKKESPSHSKNKNNAEKQDTYDYEAEDSYREALNKENQPLNTEEDNIKFDEDFLKVHKKPKVLNEAQEIDHLSLDNKSHNTSPKTRKSKSKLDEVFKPPEKLIDTAISYGKTYSENILKSQSNEQDEDEYEGGFDKNNTVENNGDNQSDEESKVINVSEVKEENDEDIFKNMQYDKTVLKRIEPSESEESHSNQKNISKEGGEVYINNSFGVALNQPSLREKPNNKIDEFAMEYDGNKKGEDCPKSTKNVYNMQTAQIEAPNTIIDKYSVEKDYKSNINTLKHIQKAKERKEEYLRLKEQELANVESILIDKQQSETKRLKDKYLEQSARLQEELQKLRQNKEEELSQAKRVKQDELQKKINVKVSQALKSNASNSEESSTQFNLKISELQKQKSLILGEIDLVKRIDIATKSKYSDKFRSDLGTAEDILKEKHDINKKNMENRFSIIEQEVKIEEESRHYKELEELRKQYMFNMEKQEAQFMMSVGKLLEEYSKAVEEEFDLESKKHLKSMQDSHDGKIHKAKEQVERESKAKETNYMNAIKDMETQYFTNLQFIREEYKMKGDAIEKRLSMQFNESLLAYDKYKKRIVSNWENFLCLVVPAKYSFMRNNEQTEINIRQNDEDDLIQSIVETLQQNYEKSSITFSSKQSQYQLLEMDVKSSMTRYEYLLQVIRDLVSFINEKDLVKDISTYSEVFSNSFSHKNDPLNPKQAIEKELTELVKSIQMLYITKFKELTSTKLFTISCLEDFLEIISRSSNGNYFLPSRLLNKSKSIQPLDCDEYLYSDRRNHSYIEKNNSAYDFRKIKSENSNQSGVYNESPYKQNLCDTNRLGNRNRDFTTNRYGNTSDEGAQNNFNREENSRDCAENKDNWKHDKGISASREYNEMLENSQILRKSNNNSAYNKPIKQISLQNSSGGRFDAYDREQEAMDLDKILSKNQFNAKQSFMQFVIREQDFLSKLKSNIGSEDNRLSNLKNSIFGTSYRGLLRDESIFTKYSSRGSTNNHHLMSCVDILEEDQLNLNRKERILRQAESLYKDLKTTILSSFENTEFIISIVRSNKMDDFIESIKSKIEQYYSLINEVVITKPSLSYQPQLSGMQPCNFNLQQVPEFSKFEDVSPIGTGQDWNKFKSTIDNQTTSGFRLKEQSCNFNSFNDEYYYKKTASAISTLRHNSTIDEIKQKIDRKLHSWKANPMN